MLIVQKFGGSSVADAEKIRRVAGVISDTYKEGNSVVVVLSAQGDTTDDLLEKAAEISKNPSKRELDMLLATGEQISISLMAMALEEMGHRVISLTGWQIGMKTSSAYGDAKIRDISTDRILHELDRKRIVLVAGFQGVNKYDDITTLGRGGSDTSAVAIAAAIKADKCQIYTDVEGIYTADPRKVTGTKKLPEITYDEMLELASLGAQVLHNRSVMMAKKYGIELEVLSSYVRKPGTKVKEVVKNVEQMKISGIAKDNDVARITVVGMPDEPGTAFKLFRSLTNDKIIVDIIIQSLGKNDTNDISFTVKQKDGDLAVEAVTKLKDSIGFQEVNVDTNVSKVSIVGAGMVTSSGVAALMFEALYEAGINIAMISTSEIKISVLVEESNEKLAMQAIHNKFFK